MWLELESVVDGGLCELDLCSVSEQPSHLTLFGERWIARCKPPGGRVVWAERRGADGQSSRLKHSRSLKPCTVWDWFPFPLEKINSSELGQQSSCCTIIRVCSCVLKLTHEYLFLISHRGATMTLRWCINSVYDAARLSWKWTPNVYPERNFLNGTHISAVGYNPEYCFTSHQLSVILYTLRGCRVDKFDVKPNHLIKGK